MLGARLQNNERLQPGFPGFELSSPLYYTTVFTLFRASSIYLPSQRALLAHGEDGLDEISPVTRTRFALLWDGELSEGILSPTGFGLEPVSEAAIQPGETAEENAELLRLAVTEVNTERCTAILPSAACAIWIAGLAPERRSATELAREVVKSGAAREKLEEFVRESNAL